MTHETPCEEERERASVEECRGRLVPRGRHVAFAAGDEIPRTLPGHLEEAIYVAGDPYLRGAPAPIISRLGGDD